MQSYSESAPESRRLYEALDRTVRLGDGRIVVANGGTGELRVYDAHGRFAASFGRKGEGPGEFEALSWIGRMRGDTVGAWDNGLMRWSLFSPSTSFVSSVTPRPAPGVLVRAGVGLGRGGDDGRLPRAPRTR